MKGYSFVVVIEKEPEDPGYFAYSPSLRGCFSDGDTVEGTVLNMREALHLHLQSILAHGEPVPDNDHVVHIEQVTVEIAN